MHKIGPVVSISFILRLKNRFNEWAVHYKFKADLFSWIELDTFDNEIESRGGSENERDEYQFNVKKLYQLDRYFSLEIDGSKITIDSWIIWKKTQ